MGSNIAVLPIQVGARNSTSSFQYSFSFLPKYQREAIRTVYAFCRTTDDIVDNKGDIRGNIERLHRWQTELEKALSSSSEYPLLNQLNAIAQRFNIPVIHFHELIKGVEMDLVKNRYETFDELRDYCYHVASSVGLMCLEIFGPRNEKTKEYAVNLGIALQLTNIVRDVGIDAGYGRIYLPMEDLRRFGCTENDIVERRYSSQFLALMEFEANRAEDYFRRAQESLPPEDKRTMFAAKIMERIYFHTLLRIKKADYNVFDKSVSLPKVLQLLIAIKYWVKHRILAA
jgi:phytoene synthase